MGKRKIINDPIYGFIQFEYDLIYDLIDHPYFQRLRHISQMGLSSMVYPGAVHTRFHHALGALHLMTKALRILRSKSVEISDEECEASCIAILLHDIGHGPFSHSLEEKIIPFHHEVLTLKIMDRLNKEFDGKLSLAIKIFKDDYKKKYLHQLVSSQLDMDRLDYIMRDSFFTGVAEGTIGYDRIINMLNVKNNSIVVEEKGIFSIEKFFHSRSIMYWQVYLHKTAIAAEQMLIAFILRLKMILSSGNSIKDNIPQNLMACFQFSESNSSENILDAYLKIDDHDIQQLIKLCLNNEDYILRFLAMGLRERKLFKIILSDSQIDSDYIAQIRQKVVNYLTLDKVLVDQLILRGFETNQTYNDVKDEIMVLSKSGEITPLSAHSGLINKGNIVKKFFLCYPKYIV